MFLSEDTFSGGFILSLRTWPMSIPGHGSCLTAQCTRNLGPLNYESPNLVCGSVSFYYKIFRLRFIRYISDVLARCIIYSSTSRFLNTLPGWTHSSRSDPLEKPLHCWQTQKYSNSNLALFRMVASTQFFFLTIGCLGFFVIGFMFLFFWDSSTSFHQILSNFCIFSNWMKLQG